MKEKKKKNTNIIKMKVKKVEFGRDEREGTEASLRLRKEKSLIINS